MLRATKSFSSFFSLIRSSKKTTKSFSKKCETRWKEKNEQKLPRKCKECEKKFFSDLKWIIWLWIELIEALTICLNNFEKIFPQSSNDRKYRRTLALKPIYSSVDKFERFKLPEKPQQERQILIIFEKLYFKMIPSRSFFS